MKYPITEKYRTIHSIYDFDLDAIISYYSSLDKKSNFVDFGCHFGHLSIQMAIEFPIVVYAVDNFVGVDDGLIFDTIKKHSTHGNFYETVEHNISECSSLFKGHISTHHSDKFFGDVIDKFDFVYNDSSHDQVEIQNISLLAERVRLNGIMAGHDYLDRHVNVAVKELLKTDKFSPIEITDGSWYLRKIKE